MKSLRGRVSTVLLLLLCALGVQPAAHADDALDKFAWMLDQLDSVGANPLPVSGTAVKEAKGLFECLAAVKDDIDAADCIVKAQNTEIGNQLTGQNTIPGWFWDLAEMYLAFRTHDYWGVVKNVGTAGVCIVAQVMTGGALDVCGLLEDLVELAKGVLDAGKAIGKFVAALGEGAWEGIQDVGCALGLGGCSKSTPAHEIVYTYIFHPRVAKQGLDAIEAVDATAFGKLRLQLSANALHNPVIWSDPSAQKAFVNHPPFAAAAVETAAKIFDQAVDAQWTGHLAGEVLKELAKQRGDYQGAQQIVYSAFEAAHAFKTSHADPAATVKASCTQEFRIKREFAHVDRWLEKYPGQSVGTMIENRGNAAWCAEVFWQKHIDAFADEFRGYVKNSIKCAEAPGGFMCPTLAAYKDCAGLLTSVYQMQQCGIALQSVGKDIAAEIQAYFSAHGSKHKCAVELPQSQAAPAVLRCTRPTQQFHCNAYYDDHYGKSPNKLPAKALDCVLSVDRVYFSKQNQLWQKTVPALAAAHPKFKQLAQKPGHDPLLVGVSPELYTEMEAQAKLLGMQTKKLLTFEPSIDGFDVPTFGGNLGSKLKAATDTIPMSQFAAPTRDGVNPPDPAGRDLKRAISSPARLTILAAQTRLETKCSGSTGQLLAAVTVTNTGDALAAGGATISVREVGKPGGGSARLPALGAGESHVILVPLTGLDSRGAGTRQLTIHLSRTAGARGAGFELPAVQTARASVPPNPCAPPAGRVPATRGN